MSILLASLINSTSPADFVPLIAKYGPAALIVFFSIYLIRVNPRTGSTAMDVIIKSTMWLSLPILAIVAIFFSYKDKYPPEYVIRGEIVNLADPQIVAAEDTVFLSKHLQPSGDFKYIWRYISKTKDTGNTFKLSLQDGPNGVRLSKFDVPIEESFYDSQPVVISFDNSGHMLLKHKDYSLTLSGQDGVSTTPPKKSSLTFFEIFSVLPIVKAFENETKIKQLVAALDDDDPAVRGQAKRILIDLGNQSIPAMAEALKGNLRTRVETLSALGQMASSAVNTLPKSAKCSVINMSHDKDQLVRSQALIIIRVGLTDIDGCECTATKLAPGRSLSFELGPTPIYVFLVKQHLGSRGDMSDLFVSNTDPNTLGSSVTERLNQLSQSQPASTRKLAVASRRPVMLNVAGTAYTLDFHSRAILGYGVAHLCVNR